MHPGSFFGSRPAVLLALILAAASSALAADLQPETLEAFHRYVVTTEALRAAELVQRNAFLYIETLPEPQRDSVWETLLQGEVFTAHLRTLDSTGRALRAPGGMIHDWVGDILIPGATIGEVLSVVQDYNHYKDIYKPETVQSRLLAHEDDNYEVYLRLYKQNIVTMTYNVISRIRYSCLDASHVSSSTVFARIAEVDDAGTANEHEKPFGHDEGYLWGVNSYWRFEQRKEGVVAEWEFISLSRSVPLFFTWFVKPLISEIARDTLRDTLNETRSEVLNRIKAGQGPGSDASRHSQATTGFSAALRTCGVK